MTNDLTLYNYFMDRLDNITEDWYDSLNTEDNGVYSSTSNKSIEILKEQNMSFHINFFKVFSTERSLFFLEMKDWINLISNDEAHLHTSNSSIINEFLRTQEQYLEILYDFSVEHSTVTSIEIKKYRELILETMRTIIVTITDEFEKNQKNLLNSQMQMITELSAPVIQLTTKTGILPLIGEIDTYRASIVFEQVLNTCSEKKLLHLIIDLSGVPIIDTMVAGKLFDLMNGLQLLGVEASLSGVRPEIAQTAVHLGIKLDRVKVYSSVDQAIANGILN
ncbi:STAS domain-containing protein [Alkalicoccobacillus porphyridii]|uniref:STAS domain-containing protein n=1 Tax=Alkalicoccobacillus porphyridii TaxID=2597270 RepID=A0A554A3A4_9BACI|nr:STAS domain-containing protein [Alkalicoccobacillus porphyridii]TSB48177.1 STAS domain-containing protein [Alkalicoccobacillus porphyridii]